MSDKYLYDKASVYLPVSSVNRLGRGHPNKEDLKSINHHLHRCFCKGAQLRGSWCRSERSGMNTLILLIATEHMEITSEYSCCKKKHWHKASGWSSNGSNTALTAIRCSLHRRYVLHTAYMENQKRFWFVWSSKWQQMENPKSECKAVTMKKVHGLWYSTGVKRLKLNSHFP